MAENDTSQTYTYVVHTALELDGGERLGLLDIVRCPVPTTELAVLSSGPYDGVDGWADASKGCTLLRQCSITDLEALLRRCGTSETWAETSPWASITRCSQELQKMAPRLQKDRPGRCGI